MKRFFKKWQHFFRLLRRRLAPVVETHRRRYFRNPCLELLEDRTLPNATPLAEALLFNGFNTAHVSHFMSSRNEVDLYSVTLHHGDTFSASVSAQNSASGLASLLRVFDANGAPLALDDQEGGDPHLSFQAATDGVYLIGVSSAPNDNYLVGSQITGGLPGNTIGLYTLDVHLSLAAPLLPDMTGSSFRLGVDMAAAGEQVPVAFTVENRGGADPGNFQVQVLRADNNLFGGSAQILATLHPSDLLVSASGRAFSSPAGFQVTLPAVLASGPADIGLRIIPDPGVPDADPSDKSGVHRGADYETLTLVTSVPSGGINLSLFDADVRTEVSRNLIASNQVDTYSFTVGQTGKLTAEVAATSGNLLPRLTLSGLGGPMLIQSDSGRIDQFLLPGQYSLSVSSQFGTGAYRLTTAFAARSPLLVPLATGINPNAVAVGDLNGDGFLDAVATNFVDNSVSVFLGNGDGSFEPPQVFAVGSGPVSVTIADVNGDGKPDLLVANQGNGTVGVLLGNGDGTFQPMTEFAVGQSPASVTVADLNGDGKPDLAVANSGDNTVSVLLGNGNGRFQTQTAFNVGQAPAMVQAADVNGDGILDLVTANKGDNTVSVLLGDGHGSFGPQQPFATGNAPTSIALGDVNGDGIPDLVTANQGDNNVGVLLGDGKGNFHQQQTIATGNAPTSIVLGDVNSDGRLDLVTANSGDNTVSVLLQHADGTFGAGSTFPGGTNPRVAAVGDFNGDGQPDIVTANQGDDTLSVLLGRGDGTFQAQQPSRDVELRNTPLLADVNGDGIPDMVVTNSAGNILFRKGLAGGAFASPIILNPGRRARDIAILRFGPGLAIAAADALSTTVSLYMVSKTGAVTRFAAFSTPSLAARLAVADLNGDGRDDLIAVNPADNSVTIAMNGGDHFIPNTVSTGIAPSDIAVAALNNDNRPDIVVSDQASGDLTVLLNDATQSFSNSLRFRAGTEVNRLDPNSATPAVSSLAQSVSLTSGDFNGDGKPDVVVVNRDTHSFTVLLGDGHGGFLAPRLALTTSTSDGFSINNRPGAVVAGDFNHDGKLDLAVLMEDTGQLWIFTGNGDGTFRRTLSIPVGPQATGLTLVKPNNGFLDVLVGFGSGQEIRLKSPVALRSASILARALFNQPSALTATALVTSTGGLALTFTQVTLPVDTKTGKVQGTLTIVGGKLIYTPPKNYRGRVTFKFAITDGINTTQVATVTMLVGLGLGVGP